MTRLSVEEQLRTYADSIDPAPADVGATNDATPTQIAMWRRRGGWLLTAAAACIIAVGLVVIGTRNDVSVETGDLVTEPVEPTVPAPGPSASVPAIATDNSEASAESTPVRQYLQADPSRWAVVEYFDPDEMDELPSLPASLTPAVWVWRAGDQLVIFLAGQRVAYGEPVPLIEAEVSGIDSRSTIGWLTPTGRVGLVGINVSTAELREIAITLDASIDDPELPGYALVLHEPEHPSRARTSEQVDLAPIGDDGLAELNNRVSAGSNEGTPGDMYRELGEASGFAVVAEVQIAGFGGFVIAGADDPSTPSYALVAADGWVHRWQTQSPDIDLVAFLDSVELVDEQTWGEAIALRDDTVKAAVEAAVDLAEVAPDGLAPAVDLPRFVLPEPWQIEWVTDMGIWTDEQRAQRAGRFQANRPNLFLPLQSRTQAFGYTAPGQQPVNAVDVELTTVIFESEPPGPLGFQEGSTPITVGELSGRASPENLAGDTNTGALNTVELSGGAVQVFVSSQVMPREIMIEFVESLVARDAGPGAGFDSTDPRFEQIIDEINEVEDPAAALLDPATSWHASWLNTGRTGGSVRMTVEQLTLGDLRLKLSRERARITGDIVETIDATGATLLSVDLPGVALRYDSRSQVLILVSTTGADVSAPDIIDNQLLEIDLEAWTTLVTPFNADPLKPR